MLFTRNTKVTLEIDTKTMKTLGRASAAMSELASVAIINSDNTAHMKGRGARR
jgi:hypothetical protein